MKCFYQGDSVANRDGIAQTNGNRTNMQTGRIIEFFEMTRTRLFQRCYIVGLSDSLKSDSPLFATIVRFRSHPFGVLERIGFRMWKLLQEALGGHECGRGHELSHGAATP